MNRVVKTYKVNSNNSAGYTLIELALVVSIIGLFLGLASSALHMYQIQQKAKTTKVNVAQISNSLGGYLSTIGRYPCPASLSDPVGTVNYGRETDCTDTSVAVGDCVGGICIEEADRIVIGPPAFTPRVRRGYIPWRALNIPEGKTYDGYGNRIEYVVTEALATDGGFEQDEGGINVVDDTNVTVLTTAATAHFAIISHGQDGKGGFNRGGAQVIPCVGGDLDVENCNTTVDDKATYRSMGKILSAANYFDDLLTYRIETERPLWKTTDNTAFDIVDLADPAGQIGVQNEPASTNKLDISGGRLRAEDNAHLLEMCDDTGIDCFDPAKIGGAGMACPPGEFAVGVAFGSLVCATDFQMTCPVGQFLSGVSAGLLPICSVPPDSCLNATKTLCSPNDSLLLAAPHNTFQTITAGDSLSETWRCNGGTWVKTAGPTGVCSCTPSTTSSFLPCGECRTGTIETVTTVTCSPYTSTSAAGANTCACDATLCPQQPDSQNCPFGYIQNFAQTRTRDFTCNLPPSTTGSWSAYTAFSDFDASCTCNPTSKIKLTSCPTGFTGTGKHEKADWTCAGNTGTWGLWYLDIPAGGDDCTCVVVTETDVDSTGCGSGYAGTIIQERTSICPGGGFTAWTEISNTCALITYSWNPLVAGETGQPVGSGFKSGTSCSLGDANASCWLPEGSGTYENFASCACQQD